MPWPGRNALEILHEQRLLDAARMMRKLLRLNPGDPQALRLNPGDPQAQDILRRLSAVPSDLRR